MKRAIGVGQAKWNAEKKTGNDASTDEGNRILAALSEAWQEPRLDLEEAVSQGLINVIDECLTEVRRLDRFQVHMDGGKTFAEFWRRGDDVFQKLKGALVNAHGELGQ